MTETNLNAIDRGLDVPEPANGKPAPGDDNARSEKDWGPSPDPQRRKEKASSPVPPPAAGDVDRPKSEVSAEVRSGEVLSAEVGSVELVLGAVALAMWFMLFGGGILVGTAPYREEIQAPQGAAHLLRSSVIVLAFWTITNVGLLCCLSAFLGALGRRTRFAIRLAQAEVYLDAVPAQVRLHYASAVIRGFSIYAIMIAGMLVLATETFIQPSQGEYLRISATAAVLSFYAGYDPEMFAGVLSRVKRLVEAGPGAGEGDTRKVAAGASGDTGKLKK